MNRPMVIGPAAAILRGEPNRTLLHHATFRPDIEGLRGVSVIAVVLYHAFPTAVPGGFVGVDVFFVISGFLITQLLLRELEATGGIDLVEFWARRIRRILPAATFVLCAVALIALCTPSIDGRLLGRHIIAAALFYYNWRQPAEGVDYLALDDRDNPLLHYWSLAVEEQFYLVWPVLLLALASFAAAKRDSRRVVFAITALLAMMSFGIALHLTWSAPSFAFFGTTSRAWQLLAGALVAMAATRLPRAPASMLVAASGAALLASFYCISDATPYPGLAALVPTAAAATLLYCGAHVTNATAWLAWPSLRLVGRVSFSWYLWHWPLIVLLGTTPLGLCAAIALSFLAAVATYHLIEQPARVSLVLRQSPYATYRFGALLLAVGVGAGFGMKHLAPDGVHIGGGVFVSATSIKWDRPAIFKDRCLLRHDDVAYGACAYGAAGGGQTVVLFGDSHAGNWFSGLEQAAGTLGWRLLVRVKAACHPVEAVQMRIDGREREYGECAAWRRNVLQELATIKPSLIVVASSVHSFPAASEHTVLERLSAIAPTIAMRDTPGLPLTTAACLRRASNPSDCTWRLSRLLSPHSYPKTRPADLPSGVRIVDLNHRVCPQDRCSAVTGGHVLMFDDHHFSNSFSVTLADEFEMLLRDAKAMPTSSISTSALPAR